MTLRDVQCGHGVSLKGGFAEGAVFLDGASMGSGAHVRPGTILEEEASGAHTVGLKQTLLLSFVTTGSLINFCDVLMAGGTDRKNHSEVGSSYIHFNFTPHGDKATPSLVGDVPRGVLLDQPPIFLGGQGGLVGPTRIEYGVVIAAGVVQRRDALEAGHLYTGDALPSTEPRPYPLGVYGSIERMVRNNLIYVGNVLALQAWYRQARNRTMRADPFREACRLGTIQQLDVVIKERVKRLQDLAGKVQASIDRLRKEPESERRAKALAQQVHFVDAWPTIKERIKHPLPESVGGDARKRFLAQWEELYEASHTAAVTKLHPSARQAARDWLQSIVDFVRNGSY